MADDECTCGRLYTFGVQCPVHSNASPIEWEVMGPVDELASPLQVAQPKIKDISTRTDDAQAIRASQEAFDVVMDQLISIYRHFDKTRRPLLKERLKTLRERLMDLGVTFGVSRTSVDKLWEG